MDSNRILVGPWGGGGGNPWQFIPDGRISGIHIRSASVVDAVSFVITDQTGNSYRSLNFGGDGGILHEVLFANDEKIIKINGRVGVFENTTVVTSLTFVTNKDTYGQYGADGGSDFSLPITQGQIIGFHGRHSNLLDSIGVILSP